MARTCIKGIYEIMSLCGFLMADQMYRAPVVMAKGELSSKYMKLVLRQLGFTDEEIDALF